MKLGYSFRCALFSSAIFISIKLAVFFTHSQFSGIGAYSGLFSLAMLSIPIFMGIKRKRDFYLDGYITIRQVMVAGVAISLMSSMIIAIYTFIHYKVIDEKTSTHWIGEARRLGTLEKKSDAEIQQAIEMLTAFYSPFKQALNAGIGVLGTGAVLSFISSAFLVKNPPVAKNE